MELQAFSIEFMIIHSINEIAMKCFPRKTLEKLLKTVSLLLLTHFFLVILFRVVNKNGSTNVDGKTIP